MDTTSCAGSTAPLATRREVTLGADLVEEMLAAKTSLDRGSPNMGTKGVPEINLTLLLMYDFVSSTIDDVDYVV